VTPTGQGQDALTGTDPTQGPEPAPAQTAGEPLKRTGRKNHRSQRADDWANTWLDDPAPCVLCGTPALLRDPTTNKPCHKTCAQAQAAERGQPW